MIHIGGEIRDCPFCGNEGMIFLSGCNGKGGELYTASCSVCGIKYDWDFPSYQEALKKWNERHGG